MTNKNIEYQLKQLADAGIHAKQSGRMIAVESNSSHYFARNGCDVAAIIFGYNIAKTRLNLALLNDALAKNDPAPQPPTSHEKVMDAIFSDDARIWCETCGVLPVTNKGDRCAICRGDRPMTTQKEKCT